MSVTVEKGLPASADERARDGARIRRAPEQAEREGGADEAVRPAEHPERPAVALRIGVTGHRQARLAEREIARIEADIHAVLRLIRERTQAELERCRWAFAESEPVFYLISPLADGADTLAAKTALEEGFRLLAPLPFKREHYEEDFRARHACELRSLLSQADAVIELDSHRGSEDAEREAYLKAGLVTVAQSDIIIAIWDGAEARGLGGTAQIKEAAVAAGKPVVWINAAAPLAPCLLPKNGAGAPLAEEIAATVNRILAPPAAEEIEHAFSGRHTRARTAYRDFLGERQKRLNYGAFYQLFERLLSGRSPFGINVTEPSVSSRLEEERASPLLLAAAPSERTKKVLEDCIGARFAWADHLATHYGALYRSSYYFNYILSALAVLLALMSLVLTQVDKPVWIALEVLVIVAVLIVTLRGRSNRWHEKWIDYRHLAEELRHFRRVFLSVGGGYDPGQDDREVSTGWVDWYLRATVREAGMTDACFTPERIRRVARAIIDSELKPQIAYHRKKAKTLHTIEHRMHRLGEAAFAATLLVCVAYLIAKGLVEAQAEGLGSAHAAEPKTAEEGSKSHGFADWLDHDGKYLVTMLSGFLPALGAAIFGIRVQGEFGSTAERSNDTAEELELVIEHFEKLAQAQEPKLAALQECIDAAGRLMLMENKDWRILYISKPLNLPG